MSKLILKTHNDIEHGFYDTIKSYYDLQSNQRYGICHFPLLLLNYNENYYDTNKYESIFIRVNAHILKWYFNLEKYEENDINIKLYRLKQISNSQEYKWEFVNKVLLKDWVYSYLEDGIKDIKVQSYILEIPYNRIYNINYTRLDENRIKFISKHISGITFFPVDTEVNYDKNNIIIYGGTSIKSEETNDIHSVLSNIGTTHEKIKEYTVSDINQQEEQIEVDCIGKFYRDDSEKQDDFFSGFSTMAPYISGGKNIVLNLSIDYVREGKIDCFNYDLYINKTIYNNYFSNLTIFLEGISSNDKTLLENQLPTVLLGGQEYYKISKLTAGIDIDSIWNEYYTKVKINLLCKDKNFNGRLIEFGNNFIFVSATNPKIKIKSLSSYNKINYVFDYTRNKIKELTCINYKLQNTLFSRDIGESGGIYGVSLSKYMYYWNSNNGVSILTHGGNKLNNPNTGKISSNYEELKLQPYNDLNNSLNKKYELIGYIDIRCPYELSKVIFGVYKNMLLKDRDTDVKEVPIFIYGVNDDVIGGDIVIKENGEYSINSSSFVEKKADLLSITQRFNKSNHMNNYESFRAFTRLGDLVEFKHEGDGVFIYYKENNSLIWNFINPPLFKQYEDVDYLKKGIRIPFDGIMNGPVIGKNEYDDNISFPALSFIAVETQCIGDVVEQTDVYTKYEDDIPDNLSPDIPSSHYNKLMYASNIINGIQVIDSNLPIIIRKKAKYKAKYKQTNPFCPLGLDAVEYRHDPEKDEQCNLPNN